MGAYLTAYDIKSHHDQKRANFISDLRRKAINYYLEVRQLRDKRIIGRIPFEEIEDLARKGNAICITFAKAGFTIPSFAKFDAAQACIGYENYFSTLYPAINEGHLKEAISNSSKVAQESRSVANDFILTDFFQRLR